MSKEKLYVVKNDKGYYWDFEHHGFWEQEIFGYLTTPSREQAGLVAFEKGGNVVTLIEEPEKVVLTKEQAEIVEGARDKGYPATYISNETDDSNAEERLLIHAYFNGYTVEKENKYGVWVPHVKGKMYYKDGRGSDDLDIASADCLNDKNQQFTEVEIKQYGLQDCEREEVADDGE